MKKMKRLSGINKVTLLFSILCLLYISAPGLAQDHFQDSLAAWFGKYCKNVPREEMFIHTDRSDYIAGEDIWCKVFLVDRYSSKPSYYSEIAYIELLNPDNRPVAQRRIKVLQGSGSGKITLSDTLSSGIYILRGYTNWMKNFMPGNCFTRSIGIYNAVTPGKFKVNGGYPGKQGGNDGMKVAVGNYDSGYKLRIRDNDKDTLKLAIHREQNISRGDSAGSFLFIHTHGIVNYSGRNVLRGDDTEITLPRKLLDPGINHITLFSQAGEPLCERFIFTPGRKDIVPDVSISGNLERRNRISLEIDLSGSLPAGDFTSLSMSVTPAAGSNEDHELENFIVFGTEFGDIPCNIRNSDLNILPRSEVDTFLLSVKSSWINWKTILSGKIPSYTYNAEKGKHYISGKLVSQSQDDKHEGQYIFLSSPGKVATFQYAKTDSAGNFSFTITVDASNRDIIIQPEKTAGDKSIRMESSFYDKYLPALPGNDSSGPAYPEHISQWGANYQVSRIYGISYSGFLRDSSPASAAAKRFYGKPDIGLVMDDYIKLPVMQEVFFELMPGVFLKKRKTGYEISVADPVLNRVFSQPPVLLIDGVVIDDASLIANLDPEIVEKIDAVKANYIVGDYLFYGIVNVITRTGDFSCVNLPGYAARMPYRVVDPEYTFSSPDYSTGQMKESRIPDLRNTLYWNPSIVPDKNGRAGVEFWSSDYITDYLIDIRGISSDGKVILCRKLIKAIRK
jgi:hypothetical protein